MPHMPTIQGRTLETYQSVTATGDPRVEMGPGHDGFCHWTTQNPTES